MAGGKGKWFSRLGGLFVPKMTRDAAAESAKEIGGATKRIFLSLRGFVRRPTRNQADPHLPPGPAERFEYLAQRDFLTEPRRLRMLKSAETNRTVLSLIAFGLLGDAVVKTGFILARGEGVFKLFSQSYAWLLAVAFGFMAFRAAILSYQLRSRRAVSWQEFVEEGLHLKRLGHAGRGMLEQFPPKPSYSPNPEPPVGKPTSGRASLLRRLRRPCGFLFLSIGALGSVIHRALGQTISTGSDAASNAVGLVAQLGSQDLSAGWLTTLFPAGVSASSGSDALGSMLVTFNTLMLDFGAGMLAWHAMNAIVEIAHEGSTASKNWHQIWSPIRVAAGATFLMPVNGYCLAQLVAIQCLAGGYLMANQLWSAYATFSLNDTTLQNSVNNMVALPPATILQAVLSAETCQAYINFYSAQAAADDIIPTDDGGLAPTDPMEASSGSNPWLSESDTGTSHIYNFGVCGTLSIGQEGAGTGDFGGFFAGSGSAGQNTDSGDSQFDTTTNKAFQALMTSVWAGGNGLPNDLLAMIAPTSNSSGAPATVTTAQITSDLATANAAVTTYTQALQGAASSVVSSGLSQFSGGVSATTKSLGWASAGTFYLAIEQLYSNVSGLGHAGMPAYLAGDTAGMDSSDAALVAKAELMPTALLNSRDMPTSTSTTSTTSGSSSSASSSPAVTLAPPASGSANSFEDYTNLMLSGPMGNITSWLINDFTLSSVNPIADMISEGNVLLASGEAIMGTALVSQSKVGSLLATAGEALTGNEGGAATTAGMGLVGSLMPGAINIVLLVGEFLIAVGVIESVILPMMIYITWLYALLNVIAFAAEFILAAPLAAFQHMRFDGQSFIEQDQRPFYTLIFNGVLRPSLLLFGLFISTFVLTAILTVFNATFKMGIIAVQGSDFIGVCQTLGLVALQVFIQYQILSRCVSLIHRVPHMVATLLKSEVTDLAGADEGRQTTIGAVGMIRSGTSKNVGALMAPPKRGHQVGNSGEGSKSLPPPPNATPAPPEG